MFLFWCSVRLWNYLINKEVIWFFLGNIMGCLIFLFRFAYLRCLLVYSRLLEFMKELSFDMMWFVFKCIFFDRFIFFFWKVRVFFAWIMIILVFFKFLMVICIFRVVCLDIWFLSFFMYLVYSVIVFFVLYYSEKFLFSFLMSIIGEVIIVWFLGYYAKLEFS